MLSYLLFMPVPCLEQCLIISHPSLNNCVVCFLLLNYKSSLNILNAYLLAEIRFASIFSHSLGCLSFSLCYFLIWKCF